VHLLVKKAILTIIKMHDTTIKIINSNVRRRSSSSV